MNRSDLMQAFLNLYADPSYLEIGVDEGFTFNVVHAAHKRAVDPAFKYPTIDTSDGNRTVTHYPVTSDSYFAAAGAGWPIDVAFIDGLHTFEQTLRDLLNVQTNLTRHGVIVIDDINPTSYHASLPDIVEAFRVRDHQARLYPSMTGDYSWMGDVYKLVFFIRDFMQGWTYACVGETGGQLVLWRQARPDSDVGTRSYRAVDDTTFRDVVSCQTEFRFLPVAEVVAQVAAAMQPG